MSAALFARRGRPLPASIPARSFLDAFASPIGPPVCKRNSGFIRGISGFAIPISDDRGGAGGPSLAQSGGS